MSNLNSEGINTLYTHSESNFFKGQDRADVRKASKSQNIPVMLEEVAPP